MTMNGTHADEATALAGATLALLDSVLADLTEAVEALGAAYRVTKKSSAPITTRLGMAKLQGELVAISRAVRGLHDEMERHWKESA